MTDLTVEKLNLREAELWGEDHYPDGTARFYEWSQPFLRELFALAKEALTVREDGGWPVMQPKARLHANPEQMNRFQKELHKRYSTLPEQLIHDSGEHKYREVSLSDYATLIAFAMMAFEPNEQTEGEETFDEEKAGRITGFYKASKPCDDCIGRWCQMNCGPAVVQPKDSEG